MIKVLVRGRNCAKYIVKCLRSLQKQAPLWEALVILDDPEDHSYTLAKAISSVDSRITLVRRKVRRGLGYNMYKGLKELETILDAKPTDIVAIVDADDWIRDDAFKIVKKIHDKGRWVTYGSYIKVSKGRRTKISRELKGDVRTSKWTTSHLKTFRYSLVKHLTKDMFMVDDWIEAASDVALMLPIVELAGLKRCKFVYDEIYYWRDHTKHKTDREKQKKLEKQIRKKPRLGKL